MSYLVDETLFKQLPKEAQTLILEQGVETKAENASVEKPTEVTKELVPDEERSGKADDQFRSPKGLKYGDEEQYEHPMDSKGMMMEMPESEKNRITDFQEANERGNDFISALLQRRKVTPKRSKDKPEAEENEV